MKRYLLFGGDGFYAHGGWADFRGAFDTEAEAIQAGIDGTIFDAEYDVDVPGYGTVSYVPYSWWHVIDAETLDPRVEHGRCHNGGFPGGRNRFDNPVRDGITRVGVRPPGSPEWAPISRTIAPGP